ncbi:hypothetical protein AMTR_s00012p00091600 [Amborella trichopoda]|uniref:Uncharacterized protein n=1 Tax=Amborella trichopoda TaxID=13333 RepID=W1PCX2_AMBTC|nr:hypothetical protein AMTR_s00012p00091600 [Amborella trichopoda]
MWLQESKKITHLDSTFWFSLQFVAPKAPLLDLSTIYQASTGLPCDDGPRSKKDSPASPMAEEMKPELCEEEERRERVEILR